MRSHALLNLTVFLSALSAGCSQWPGPEHREVTLEGINTLLQEQCQPDAELQNRLASIEQTIQLQSTQLESSSQSLQTLAQRNVESVVQVRDVIPSPECSAAKPTPAEIADRKLVVGTSEWLYLTPPGHYLSARIDTGAETSSISARNIVRFERDGKRWVAFDLDTGTAENDIHLELPLKRNVRIRQASFDDIDRRPVVVFDVRIGSLVQPTEFTLADRSRMSHPVLIGRSFLKDVAVVDVGQEYLHPKVKVKN